MPIDPSLWTDEFAAVLQRVLNSATPIGAYCAGMVTVAVISRTEELPTATMLQAALKCGSPREGERLAKRCVRDTILKQRRRAVRLMRQARKTGEG